MSIATRLQVCIALLCLLSGRLDCTLIAVAALAVLATRQWLRHARAARATTPVDARPWMTWAVSPLAPRPSHRRG